MAAPPRKRHLGAEQRRALQLLASSPFGAAEAIMFAHGFTRRMRAGLVRAGLAARREPGGFRADISALADEPEEILVRFLADELKLISGGKPLRLERLEALALRFRQALRAGTAFAATLGGAALRLQSDRTLVIAREKARGGATKRRGPNRDVRLT